MLTLSCEWHRFVALDDVTFEHPVPIGSFLQLAATVEFAQGVCWVTWLALLVLTHVVS